MNYKMNKERDIATYNMNYINEQVNKYNNIPYELYK